MLKASDRKSGLFLIIEKFSLFIKTKLTSAIVKISFFLLRNFEITLILGLLSMLNSLSIIIFSPRNKGDLYFIEVLIKGKSKPFLVSSK